MSSIHSVSPYSAIPAMTPAATPSRAQEVVSDLQSTSASLQAGNLAAAQQTFSSLAQLTSAQVPANSKLGQALSSLGQALQSGTVSSAQQALSNVGSDVVGILTNLSAASGGSTPRIDAAIASLEATIPGVTGPGPNSAASNVSADTPTSNNLLNVVA